ncbi:MAG: DUF359 domain-containing protein [Ferroplasma sp.]
MDEINEFSKAGKIITVGDVTTENILNAGIPVMLQVVDLKTKRNERNFKHVDGSIKVENPPGMITMDLFNKIKESLESGKASRIEVNGEEDLAVIPIIFYAESNTVIVYGIPYTGMAYIKVDGKIKNEIKAMLEGMNRDE